ncbi:transmembrane protein 186 [Scaptodrosophila lebanonensis]|uniref:Transmembrane protein 186 n=1 Tax=Drosophila lebanonensis TaxID=7225 RepID=A0A6J2TEX4_DROLE|nr:transmembrane protein 186 [Scaptodrosophila lebanonensis]
MCSCFCFGCKGCLIMLRRIPKLPWFPSVSCTTKITAIQPQHNWRNIATVQEPAVIKTKTEVSTEKTTEWRTIYKLPIIRLVSAFNRLKIYQALLTAAGTPLAFALGEAGHISTHAASVCASIGVTGLITLTLGSYAAKNLVGFIYINEPEDHLKLAYVDFWGRRKETLIAIDDIPTVWDQSGPPRFSFYQLISDPNCSNRRYKLLHRLGTVTDPQLFVGLFGE